jgi:micrococcal nuclease
VSRATTLVTLGGTLLGLGAAAAGCGASGPSCGVSSGVVDRVIDGDTIVLTTGEKIRYLLVNAPETTNGHNDCYGSNAAQFNSDLVLGKTVDLSYDVQCTDRYGRLLAYVSGGGTEVNSLLVERGYACVLHIPPDGDDRAAEFTALEADARAANRGLWGACMTIPCN